MSLDEHSFRLGGELEVPRLGFGAMRITGAGIWGEPESTERARALLRHVAQSGVALIDTADSYGPEVSERLIADALHPYPEDLVIATKGGFERSGPGRWEPNCRPERLRHCCEGSLRRLKLERIDLYQLHTVDPAVPIEDSIAALAELRQEEKIRYIGVSNVSAEQLARARQIVEVVSVQNRYSVADRSSQDVLEVCRQDGVAFLPWAPLAAGRLAEPGGAAHRDRPSARRVGGSGRARLAAGGLRGHAADPGHQLDPALRGEPRRGRAGAERGRARAAQ